MGAQNGLSFLVELSFPGIVMMLGLQSLTIQEVGSKKPIEKDISLLDEIYSNHEF